MYRTNEAMSVERDTLIVIQTESERGRPVAAPVAGRGALLGRGGAGPEALGPHLR